MQTHCYRATLRKRGVCCHPVSVRPFVTLVYCIHTAEDIVKLLSQLSSPIILVFDPQRQWEALGDKIPLFRQLLYSDISNS